MIWTGSILTLDVVADLGGNHDLSELRAALEPLLTPQITYFGGSETAIIVELDAEPGQAEKDAVAVEVTVHFDGALQRARRIRDAEFDKRTEELITSLGFTHNGHVFSTSSNAQSKWHAIQIMNLMGAMAFPLEISTKAEVSYAIADSAELSLMYGTMVGSGKVSHDSGKAIKDAVGAITSDTGQPDTPPNYHDRAAALAAIAAVVDNR